jgi:Ca2+-binding RTX toxin-like protein
MIGGFDNDTLDGGEGNDVLNGNQGSDNLKGGKGDDFLFGPDPISGASAVGSLTGSVVDTLTGGAGKDLFGFVAANRDAVIYDDLNKLTPGINDYALITDFKPSEDIIQLRGTAANYLLQPAPFSVGSSAKADTGIFFDKPIGEPDELIAVVQDVSGLSLNSGSFNFF